MPTWGDIFISSFQNAWYNIALYLPRILGAIIIVVIGWLIGRALEFLIVKIFNVTKLEHFFERIGLKEEMQKMGINISVGRIVGKIIKWFIVILTLIAAMQTLEISEVNNFLTSLVLYLPNVLAAIAILAIGLIIGKFLQKFISKSATTFKMNESNAKILGLVAKWSIVIFAGMAALVQLNIASSLIQILFAGIVIMFAIAGGIAFGLGGKNQASVLIDNLAEKGKEKAEEKRE